MNFKDYIQLEESTIEESVNSKYLNTFYVGSKGTPEKVQKILNTTEDILFKYIPIATGEIVYKVGSADFDFQVFLNDKPTDYFVQLSDSGAGSHYGRTKSGKANKNSEGQKLTDAGERATVLSLFKPVLTPEDTKEKLFIDNPSWFDSWANTFITTPDIVNKIIGGDINGFEVVHDASAENEFTRIIHKFSSTVAGKQKDSWNPADIWVFKKKSMGLITTRLTNIVDGDFEKDVKVQMFNNEIYNSFLEKELFPISLKQIINDPNKVEYTNIPDKNGAEFHNYKINNLTINFSYDTAEIGNMSFLNKETNKNVTMQVRGFPSKYGTAQTEIPSDGTDSGGRIGKVPSGIIDKIMAKYKMERIKSIRYFGTAKGKPKEFLSNVDDKTIKEWINWYTVVKADSATKVDPKIPKIKEHLEEYVEKGRTNEDVAVRLVHKISGLKQQYFFIKNKDKISDIMNGFVNGAKKISVDNGFFIKVW